MQSEMLFPIYPIAELNPLAPLEHKNESNCSAFKTNGKHRKIRMCTLLGPTPTRYSKFKSMHETKISHNQKKGIGKPLICLSYIP